jgi:hypothetical protein
MLYPSLPGTQGKKAATTSRFGEKLKRFLD